MAVDSKRPFSYSVRESIWSIISFIEMNLPGLKWKKKFINECLFMVVIYVDQGDIQESKNTFFWLSKKNTEY